MLAEELNPQIKKPSQASTHNKLHVVSDLRKQWKSCADKAHHYHKQGKIAFAYALFRECIHISEQLLFVIPSQHTDLSGIELLYFASHNLAACQNQLHTANKAKETLLHAYQQCIWLCEHPDAARAIKLDALAVLDKSLFSLASQLAYMAQVESIQDLIIETDNFAQRIQNQLM